MRARARLLRHKLKFNKTVFSFFISAERTTSRPARFDHARIIFFPFVCTIASFLPRLILSISCPKKKMAPPNMPKTDGTRLASFDGDADRLVYYFFKDGQFNLMVSVALGLYVNFSCIIMIFQLLLQQQQQKKKNEQRKIIIIPFFVFRFI